MMPMLCYIFGLIIKNYNFNESPGWIGLIEEAMLSGYLGLHTWLSTQDCVVVITWEFT
jgi:hypothetical protein